MTKKISCRVIDTTALSDEQPDLQLGWGFDSAIYTQSDKSQNVFTPRIPTHETYTNPNPAGQTIDCYA
ncbi:MAG: hypothetical protein WC374_09645 [Phycisphaerae bacterium]|jgi:hypothetical protein